MDRPQVRLGIVSEVHIVPPGSPPSTWHNPLLFDQAEALFRSALARCVEQDVDAIAILGDLTHYADPASFAVVRRALEEVDLPVYVLPGNHDLDGSEKPLAAFQTALDLPQITIPPRTVALTPEIDLALISLEPQPGSRKYAAVRSRAESGNDAMLTVVLTHFPAFAMQELLAGADLKHAGDLVNREPLLEALAALPGPVLILNGHLHVHATIVERRTLQLSVAALIEPPHDVTIVEIGIDDVGRPRIERGASELMVIPGVALPVLSPRQESWHFSGERWVAG